MLDRNVANRQRLRANSAGLSIANIGMAGRCVQGLIDVLERNYGGDMAEMPYVVNKEAFK